MDGIKPNIREFFFRYQISLILAFFTAFLITFLLFYSFQKLGLISYKYSDKQIQTIIDNIEVEGFKENMNLTYVKLEDGKLISTNMNEEKANAYYNTYLANIEINNYLFKKVIYQNQVFILGFPTNYIYMHEDLQNNFKEPFVNAIGLFIILVVLFYMFLTKRLYQKIEKDFHTLLSITNNNEVKKDTDSTITIFEISMISTSLIEMKNELISSKKNIQNQNNTMKTQVMSLSHDLKVPFSIIKGNSELIRKQPNSQKNDKRLSSIMRQINRIDQFLTDFSAFVKVQNFEEITTTYMCCNEFLDIVHQSINDYCAIKRRKLIFTSYIENEKKCKVHIDYITRAVNNVLKNALDYSKKDIFLVFQVRVQFLQVDIIDYGNGFSQEEMIKCKELFYTQNTSRTGGNHYGIGLSFADKIVKLHEGDLSIHSEKNKFSRVTIILPVYD